MAGSAVVAFAVEASTVETTTGDTSGAGVEMGTGSVVDNAMAEVVTAVLVVSSVRFHCNNDASTRNRSY